MHTVNAGQCAIDSVRCVSASVKQQRSNEAPTVQLNMVYSNSETDVTFGTCPVQESILSVDSRELLRKFLESAERDFGRLLFGGESFQKPSKVESQKGIGNPLSDDNKGFGKR